MSNNRLDLSTPAITKLLTASPVYCKQATVSAVQVETEQPVTTIVNGDYVETDNIAYPGDWIVTSPGGEKSVLIDTTFKIRYAPIPGAENLYQALGLIVVTLNPIGSPISIIAPWGKEQLGDENCYIAAIYSDGEISNHRYLIEHDVFHATYVKEA